ncbi:unnamed protein product [Adineta steineri]|uniref:PARP catalytic domain-containing protein n=1 Tax=Adineta steineri TaxID=433720 RepID=A0A813VB69_9BILA|nr:unnamed protein product [Adineta steineri]CAF1535283.1 unnamed protein product [Adineta steineri]CAF4159390.1 unnamed protein product [Adineta steineri]
MSDIGYDIYDYKSSQNSFDIEYQIDLFEFRQSWKLKKNKQKVSKSSYPISIKTLQSQQIFIKENCMGPKKKSKPQKKSPRKNNKSNRFECDKIFLRKTSSTKTKDQYGRNFPSFQRYFYNANRQSIRSSLKENSNIEVVNIRRASVDQSVQKEFMKTLAENSPHPPDLVYHGTKLENIESILRYGFLIPNQAHPSDKRAPIVSVVNGQSYGTGIYCSYTATFSLGYSHTTNTLLVCAAMPKRNEAGNAQNCHQNILVLPHVSQIIPLFLIDFQYLDQSGLNHPFWFNYNRTNGSKEEKEHMIIPRKYLQKILNCMNDRVRNNNRYQLRMFDLND